MSETEKKAAEQPNVHELKTWPNEFQAVLLGAKVHEYRRDDRGYRVGDVLVFKEYCPDTGYTGRQLSRVITYIGKDGFGIPDGYAVLSIKNGAARTPPDAVIEAAEALMKGLNALFAEEPGYDEVETEMEALKSALASSPATEQTAWNVIEGDASLPAEAGEYLWRRKVPNGSASEVFQFDPNGHLHFYMVRYNAWMPIPAEPAPTPAERKGDVFPSPENMDMRTAGQTGCLRYGETLPLEDSGRRSYLPELPEAEDESK